MSLEEHIKKLKNAGFRFFGDERGHKLSIDLFVILAYQKYGFREDYYKILSGRDEEAAIIQLETLDEFSYTFKFTKT